jgi:hypothetical protein
LFSLLPCLPLSPCLLSSSPCHFSVPRPLLRPFSLTSKLFSHLPFCRFCA